MASSASNQKLCKLSIISSESGEAIVDDSVSAERTPTVSLNQLQEDIQFLVTTMKTTLSTRGIYFDEGLTGLEGLKYFTSLISSEFLKATQVVKEVYLNESTKEGPEEVSVNLIRNRRSDILSKIFEIPNSGLELSKKECEELTALLVGAIRDSGSHELREKVTIMQNRIIAYAQNTQDLKLQLTEKDREIKELRAELEKLKTGKKAPKRKQKQYCESESTLNESFDAIN